jgi:hypothetical protein
MHSILHCDGEGEAEAGRTLEALERSLDTVTISMGKQWKILEPGMTRSDLRLFGCHHWLEGAGGGKIVV